MLRRLFKDWQATEAPTTGVIRQVGALPYAVVDGRMAFLLVTSRRSGRWIFPKGAIEPDLTPWDSAALEAYEEAGVLGEVEQVPIGSYRAAAGSGARLIDIDLYPLRVTQQLDSWKEKGQRLRHWVTVRESRRLLVHRDLADLVAGFHDARAERRRA
ncbi:NUDIX hydrolase [Devosia sp.]|uniref:NUDIX hydrolase n=1 Tax=Devosia sp. TaxID=1871048 RepID=UPI0025F76946|nr:NUDIX hydrolase [Devosia sp.]MCR6634365.1 NUDIX hydrolase [Devosia sp.]